MGANICQALNCQQISNIYHIKYQISNFLQNLRPKIFEFKIFMWIIDIYLYIMIYHPATMFLKNKSSFILLIDF